MLFFCRNNINGEKCLEMLRKRDKRNRASKPDLILFDKKMLGWSMALKQHRFSAFWLRSKCSICSYQLNIWYGLHSRSRILNWFLTDWASGWACSPGPAGCHGIALLPWAASSSSLPLFLAILVYLHVIDKAIMTLLSSSFYIFQVLLQQNKSKNAFARI